MTTFIATSGNDNFNGTGGASDTVDYSAAGAATAGISVNLATAGAQNTGGSGQDTFVSIENIIGTGFNDYITAFSGGTHSFSMGGGDDQISVAGNGVWTVDGGAGEDYFTADLTALSNNLTFNYDGSTRAGTLTGGTTFANMERFGINFGNGNDTVNITHGMGYTGYQGTTLDGIGGDDTFTVDGFRGLNNKLYGGFNSGGAVENDTLNLSLTGGMNATVSYISKSSFWNFFELGVNASTGDFSGSEFEHLNYTLDDGNNRVVVNGLPVFESNISLHVDAAGGTDGLEMNLAVTGAETQNVVWTITGAVTTQSNIGYFDHFETLELRLGGGANLLHMGDEADTIYSMAGQDTIYGGAGNDHLEALFYNHTVQSVTYSGGDGNDFLAGNSAADNLSGDTGNDSLIGNGGNDTLTGGGGNDSLEGDIGSDSLSGGDGDDTLVGDGSGLFVFGADDHDTLDGGAGNDVLKGGGVLNGGSGNDIIFVGYGSVDGGGGVDFAVFTGNSTDYAVLANGNDLLVAPKGTGLTYAVSVTNIDELRFDDLQMNVADIGVGLVVSGTVGNDTLDGNAFADIIDGGDGNDLLRGYGNDDAMTGGNGADTLYGGVGRDTIDGGVANDVISGDDGNDRLIGGDGDDSVVGGDGNDVVIGSTAGLVGLATGTLEHDTLDGGAGDDSIFGNGAYNSVLGGDGNDFISSSGATINGGLGNDTIVAHGNSDGSIPTVHGGDGDDSISPLYDGPKVFAFGQNGNDYVSGAGQNDTLDGGSGNDTLQGNGGADLLTGGTGADVFAFMAAGANGLDTVQDFVHGTDILQFIGADYGFAAGHLLTGSEFTTGATAVGSAAQFVWNAASHTLYWDHDGAAGDAAVAIATFVGDVTLTGADFHFS